MSFKWSRDLIEKLITAIEQNSCIFNIKSKEYLDRNNKAIAYNSILEDMKLVENSITLEEIKRKWKNLRTQYSQELRKIHNSKKSGAGTEDVYIPKLWCFQQLNFLKPYSEIRNSVDNIEFANQTIQTSTSSPLEENLIDEPPKKKQKNSCAVNALRNDLDKFHTIISQRKSEKKFAWLGNLITCQMEDIHQEDQSDAAWKLQCFMRKLTNESLQRRRLESNSSQSTSSLRSSKDILELSMEGIFDDDDFN